MKARPHQCENPARAYQGAEPVPMDGVLCMCGACLDFRREAAIRRDGWERSRSVYRAEHPHKTREEIA